MTKLNQTARELQRHVKATIRWKKRLMAESHRFRLLVKIVELFCKYIDKYDSEPFWGAFDTLQVEYDLTKHRIGILAEKHDEEKYIVNQKLIELDKLVKHSDDDEWQAVDFKKYVDRKYYTNIWFGFDDSTYDFEKKESEVVKYGNNTAN